MQRALWSPDGRTLLLSCRERDVNEYAPPRGLCTADVAATAQKPALITSPEYGWDDPQSWSPDGTRILFLRNAPAFHGLGQLWTVKPGGSEPVLIGGGPDDPDQHWSAAWSPDGQSLAFTTAKRTTDSSQKRTVKLWVADAAGNGRRLLFDGGVSVLGWSPDGRQIYVLMDNVLRSITVADGARGEPDPGVLFPHAMSWPTEAFSPDGTLRGSSLANSIVIARADGRSRARACERCQPASATTNAVINDNLLVVARLQADRVRERRGVSDPSRPVLDRSRRPRQAQAHEPMPDGRHRPSGHSCGERCNQWDLRP